MATGMEFKTEIDSWIAKISKPEPALGGMSVCPFAKGAEYELIKTDGSDINPPPWEFELIVYLLPKHYTISEVTGIANEYNKIHPDMVFLPDPKDKYTEINGVQTNNGEHNLILCQWRDNLDNARAKLQKTTYYTYWAEEYLKEILSS
jgi:hypothetical protein